MSAQVHRLKPALPAQAAAAAAADIHLIHARIRGMQGDTLLVDHPGCDAAHRALSCLIVPQIDDLVLLDLDATSRSGHVLAILERPGVQQSSLTLPGGGQLLARDGQLHLRAPSLHLEGQQNLALNTAQLQVSALGASTSVKHWQGWFDTLEAHAVSIQYSAKTLSARVGRLLSRALESFRSVDGLDETRAGRSRTTVRDQHDLRAGHINARAEGFVRIDGQKIDLG